MIISIDTEEAFEKIQYNFIIKNHGKAMDLGTITQHNKVCK